MVTLQKKFTTGPNFKLVHPKDAKNTRHTISIQTFCDKISNYEGWTIVDVIFEPNFDANTNQDIYLATCDWLDGFKTTCFDLCEDVFDCTKNILLDLIGKTICAVGPIDNPEIKYYMHVVKQYNIAKTKLQKQNNEPEPEVTDLELAECTVYS